ncbi:MAG: hypothetical protein JXQ71_16050 [Verrucomicrobia bacterium]|nr:hypothetical protein [Verrucomicrobiota bacterium]
MTKTELWTRLARKGTNPEKIAAQAVERRGLLPALLEGLEAAQAPVKFGCAKVLRLMSGKEPSILYPHVDLFIALLAADNSFLKWDAIRIVANLAAVDDRGRIEHILDDYLQFIRGTDMITATNTMAGAAAIALAKPALADKIARAILKVQWAAYETDECRNVAIGQAIESLDRFYDRIGNPGEVLEFVRSATRNARPATRKKAADFLKKRDRSAR